MKPFASTSGGNYYQHCLRSLIRRHIRPGTRILEIGSDAGERPAAPPPWPGVRVKAEEIDLKETFDFIVLAGSIGEMEDVQPVLEKAARLSHPGTRLVITSLNAAWSPLLKLACALGLRRKNVEENWLSMADLENLLTLTGFETVRKSTEILMPVYIPLLSSFLNRFMARIRPLEHLALVQMIVAKPQVRSDRTRPLSCSVIIPTKNEKGNIEAILRRTPRMGTGTELIFVDDASSDGTPEEIKRRTAAYPDKDVRLIVQSAHAGKREAVHKGFQAAKGDALMILDADLSVPPEELPRFFNALAEGKGEFINGTRLVYPLEPQAMRFLNMCANRFFSILFTWLLNQRFRDTLCGTKAFFKKDYERIMAIRDSFGNFDPFGDFELIFGASAANLKILEIPVHYRRRTYGQSKIQRFRHGWLLLRMSWLAFTKIKCGSIQC